jgi:hypothetical protein
LSAPLQSILRSSIRGWNDHIDFDHHEAIEAAVEEGLIDVDSDAYGMAQQVTHQGYNSLSSKQRFVYDRDIGRALKELDEEEDSDEDL